MAVATRANPVSSDCDSTLAYQLDVIEVVVVGGLHERMVDHDRIALYVRIYNVEQQALAADSARAHRRAAKGIERVDGRISPRVAVISTGDKFQQPEQDGVPTRLPCWAWPAATIGYIGHGNGTAPTGQATWSDRSESMLPCRLEPI